MDHCMVFVHSNANFQQWAETVKDRPAMIDINSRQGLIPIWKLARTDSRKKQLRDATDGYFDKQRIIFSMADGPVLEAKWVNGREHYTDAGSGARKDFRVNLPVVACKLYLDGSPLVEIGRLEFRHVTIKS